MSKLIQTQCPLIAWLLLVCASTLQSGCSQHQYASPPGYDLLHPQKVELGKVLNEISGLSYDKQNNSLVAISDNKEKVIDINLHKQKLKDITGEIASPKQDFEDVVLMDSTLYILASRGVIWQVPVRAKDSTQAQAYQFGSTEQNEFETLYYDAEAHGLIMLCKTCGIEKGRHTKSAFRFDLADKKFDSSVYYTINTDSVKEVLKNKDADIKPSAAAINPIDKHLYILSSAGQLLLIADTHGQVLEGYRLDPRFFPQAEGIAFAPNGTMFISNEGKFGKPSLLIFTFTKSARPPKHK